MPRLIILSKDRSAKQVYISGRMTTIGRNPTNSLVVDRDRVSRKHAVIDWDGEQYTIIDIGSRNGTFVNGKRIEMQVLANGDNIDIAGYWMRFLAPEQELIGDESVRLLSERGNVA